MKNINILRATVSSIIVYAIGISVFVGSYFIPLMDDQDLQANLFLMMGIIPAGYIASRFYYNQRLNTRPIILGMCLFAGAIVLDALITVPVFIRPLGGDHFTFFGDPMFWLIGLEYVLVISISGRVIMETELAKI